MARLRLNGLRREGFGDHVQMLELDAAKIQTLLDEAYKSKLY